MPADLSFRRFQKVRQIVLTRCQCCWGENERYAGATRCNAMVNSRTGRIVCGGTLVTLHVVREEVEPGEKAIGLPARDGTAHRTQRVRASGGRMEWTE